MNQKKTKLLAYSGLMTAIIAVATAFLKIPTAIGYFHVGDGFIFLAGFLLGPIGALAAGFGSALADLFAGYVIYAPVTFAIKALMGLIAGYSFRRGTGTARLLLTCVGAEILMMLGYFLFEKILYGTAAAAAVIITNGLQGLVGVAVGFAAIELVKRSGFMPLS